MKPLAEQAFAEGNDQNAKTGAEDTPVVTVVDLLPADELDEDDAEDDDDA